MNALEYQFTEAVGNANNKGKDRKKHRDISFDMETSLVSFLSQFAALR